MVSVYTIHILWLFYEANSEVVPKDVRMQHKTYKMTSIICLRYFDVSKLPLCKGFRIERELGELHIMTIRPWFSMVLCSEGCTCQLSLYSAIHSHELFYPPDAGNHCLSTQPKRTLPCRQSVRISQRGIHKHCISTSILMNTHPEVLVSVEEI